MIRIISYYLPKLPYNLQKISIQKFYFTAKTCTLMSLSLGMSILLFIILDSINYYVKLA